MSCVTPLGEALESVCLVSLVFVPCISPCPPVDLLCLLSVMNHSYEYNSLYVELYCGPPSASSWRSEGTDSLHDCLVAFSVSEERFEAYNSIYQLIDILFNFSVWIFIKFFPYP